MNKLIIASAGSGKTRLIVNDAIKKARDGMSVLITTFTEACEEDIKNKIIEKEGCIPKEIKVQTWFSFLISHGVKPFQGSLFEFDIKGLLLISGQSARYTSEHDIAKHYFSSCKRVYSDKLAKLVVKCNSASQGMVFKRISNCFKYIYIDEIQDFAGYDLEVLDCLFKADSNILLVGDPRQATYSTNNSRKNKKYVKSEIVNFFADNQMNIETDTESLTVNHRCSKSICVFSNLLYPEFPPATPKNNPLTGHDGVFAVLEEDLEDYLIKFNPVQLRDSIKKAVNENFDALNIGVSKGLTFDRVVIYPTVPIINWLKDHDFEITRVARAKLYVALTRAINSVAIVLNRNQIKMIKGLEVYNPNNSCFTQQNLI
jgi:DNA helicase-2/ATP-dependent DNA helicase PcrA